MEQLRTVIQQVLDTRHQNVSQFAAERNVDDSFIYRILRGDVKQLTFDNIDRLAEALDVPPWQIMMWAGIRLGLPDGETERVRRLDSLAQQQPSLRQLLDQLIDLAPAHPEYVDAALGYLEFARSRSEATPPPSRSDD